MEEWQSRLDAGDTEAAWNLFLTSYRSTILAVIRRLVSEPADAMDIFATICASLAADGCARLRQYSHRAPRASVAAWLVVVARNLTIDWIRSERGRRRIAIPASLSPLQREIFATRCIEGASPTEAYELLRARVGLACTYTEFLREARATDRAAPCPERPSLEFVSWDDSSSATDEASAAPVESGDRAAVLEAALGEHPADVRLAIELFVLDGLPAADVARIVRWRNGKAVYNRVYRALDAVRRALVSRGISSGDL